MKRKKRNLISNSALKGPATARMSCRFKLRSVQKCAQYDKPYRKDLPPNRLIVSEQSPLHSCLNLKSFHNASRNCNIREKHEKRAESGDLSDNASSSASAFHSVRHLRPGVWWISDGSPAKVRAARRARLYTVNGSRMRRLLVFTCIITVALAIYHSLMMQALKNVVVVGGSYVGSVSRADGTDHSHH